MAGGRCKYEEGTTEAVSDVKDIRPLGGIFQDLQNLLQGCSTGGALIRLGDVVDYLPDQPKPGGFQTKGGPPSGEDTTVVQHRGDVGVSPIFGGDVRGGIGGGGDIRPPPPKHYSPIYCDLYNIGDVSGGGAADGRMGGQ